MWEVLTAIVDLLRWRDDERKTKPSVELYAHLKAAPNASLIVTLNNRWDEPVTFDKLQVFKPRKSEFVKEKPDGFRPVFLKIGIALGPKGEEAANRGIEAMIRLPRWKQAEGTEIGIGAHYYKHSDHRKASWVYSRTPLKIPRSVR